MNFRYGSEIEVQARLQAGTLRGNSQSLASAKRCHPLPFSHSPASSPLVLE